jgi:hypothetical protein
MLVLSVTQYIIIFNEWQQFSALPEQIIIISNRRDRSYGEVNIFRIASVASRRMALQWEVCVKLEETYVIRIRYICLFHVD